MSNVPKMFGSLVFNETVMKDRLPTATYKTFKNAVLKGEALDHPSRRAASALECPACSRVSRRRRSAYVMWWNFAIANTSAPSVAQHGGQRQAAGAVLRAALGKR